MAEAVLEDFNVKWILLKFIENSPNIPVNNTKDYLLMFNDYPDVLTLADVCEILRVGKNKASYLLNSVK